jgi:uncharacterized protein (UPF0262 family)
MGEGGSAPSQRLIAVTVDEASLGPSTMEAMRERDIAIYDLLADNRFELPGHAGPYKLNLTVFEGRLLAFDIRDESDGQVMAHILSLGPFRPLVLEYIWLCGRHHAAIRSASPSQIEAIDMGRRGMHNDGASLLIDRLKGKIDLDFPTARRLFTLIVALGWER